MRKEKADWKKMKIADDTTQSIKKAEGKAQKEKVALGRKLEKKTEGLETFRKNVELKKAAIDKKLQRDVAAIQKSGEKAKQKLEKKAVKQSTVHASGQQVPIGVN